jgi:hypothetical protein
MSDGSGLIPSLDYRGVEPFLLDFRKSHQHDVVAAHGHQHPGPHKFDKKMQADAFDKWLRA